MFYGLARWRKMNFMPLTLTWQKLVYLEYKPPKKYQNNNKQKKHTHERALQNKLT